jgi:hypothetical protein
MGPLQATGAVRRREVLMRNTRVSHGPPGAVSSVAAKCVRPATRVSRRCAKLSPRGSARRSWRRVREGHREADPEGAQRSAPRGQRRAQVAGPAGGRGRAIAEGVPIRAAQEGKRTATLARDARSVLRELDVLTRVADDPAHADIAARCDGCEGLVSQLGRGEQSLGAPARRRRPPAPRMGAGSERPQTRQKALCRGPRPRTISWQISQTKASTAYTLNIATAPGDRGSLGRPSWKNGVAWRIGWWTSTSLSGGASLFLGCWRSLYSWPCPCLARRQEGTAELAAPLAERRSATSPSAAGPASRRFPTKLSSRTPACTPHIGRVGTTSTNRYGRSAGHPAVIRSRLV